MSRAQHLIVLLDEVLNRGEKIVLGAVGSGILAHHLANKYGIDIGYHLGKAHDTVKHALSSLSGSHNDSTSSYSSSSHIETPETRPYHVETHHDVEGNVTGETHHSQLSDGTPVRRYIDKTTEYDDSAKKLGRREV